MRDREDSDHYCGADHDRCDDQRAAEDEIADRTIAPRGQPENGAQANSAYFFLQHTSTPVKGETAIASDGQ